MNEDGPSQPETSLAAPEPDIHSRSTVPLVPNPAIAWLRFIVWIMPTAILIGCLILSVWLERTFSRSQVWPILCTCLGVAAVLSCGWFDSKLVKMHRNCFRPTVPHIYMFFFSQVLVIPAVLFASLFAFCAASSL